MPKQVVLRKRSQKLAWLSLTGLSLLLLTSFLIPITPTSSAATITNTVSTNATLNIKSAVAVSLTTNLRLEVIPEASGSFTTATADLTVATNNVTGYSVYLSAGNDSKLTASDKTNSATIDPVDGMMNYTNYQEHLGTWGYADITGMADEGRSSNYKAVPSTNEDALFSSTSEASEDSYSLGFATAIGLDQPAGLYSGSILVSVVANPKEVTNLSELTYMQDMTSSICSNTMDYVDKDNYITKQLIDIRDGKSYWVAKLKDGNCWMVQNLALDLASDSDGHAAAKSVDEKLITLDSSNTDFNESYIWNLPANRATETAIPSVTTINYNDVRSWNLGNLVMISPTGFSCSSVTDSQSLPDVCTFFKDVTDLEPTFQATATTSYDPETNSYDAHYLIGNHYQFGAATAGTGVNLAGPSESQTNPAKLANAPSSICPRGWQLPKSGRNNTSSTVSGVVAGAPFDLDNSYWKLLIKYGYSTQGWTYAQYSGGYTLIAQSSTRVDLLPLAFSRSGRIDPGSGNLNSVSNGFYWSSTAFPEITNYAGNSYSLMFNDNLFPAFNDSRRMGMSVRCLAR